MGKKGFPAVVSFFPIKSKSQVILADSYPTEKETINWKTPANPFHGLTEMKSSRFPMTISSPCTSNILGCFQDPCFIIIDFDDFYNTYLKRIKSILLSSREREKCERFSYRNIQSRIRRRSGEIDVKGWHIV